MVVRMLPKLTILLFITSIIISTVLSGIPVIKDTKLPKKFQDPLKSSKNDIPSSVDWPGRRLRPPPKKLGAPEPPSLPQNHEAPINLMIKDLPPPPQKDALKNNNTKDLKTDNSYAYYSYWDWPYYYYYWPYYYYGLGYKYKYLPSYTSYWGKWNNYYAYPYYSYYDHYYYDDDDDDDNDYYDNYYYWYRRR